MALGTFIAGRYTGTYRSQDVGITRDGYKITMEGTWEDIGDTDAYGDSVIDGVFRGGQCHCDFVSTEYKAGPIDAIWPFGGTLAGAGAIGILINPGTSNVPIGVLASDLAKTFVLTSVAGTPAVATPATLTATKALLAKNHPGALLFHSKLRDVPIRLRFYPYDAGSSVIRFFSTT